VYQVGINKRITLGIISILEQRHEKGKLRKWKLTYNGTTLINDVVSRTVTLSRTDLFLKCQAGIL
jgi:hypothetical protein